MSAHIIAEESSSESGNDESDRTDERMPKTAKRKVERFGTRKSSRERVSKSVTYAEADSDDETFRVPIDDKPTPRSVAKSQKTTRGQVIESSGDDDSSEDESSDGEPNYRIQHILAIASHSAAEWRKLCDHMTTYEVTKGSVWQQPDSEYFDPSPVPVVKYLIKWAHASFLHI